MVGPLDYDRLIVSVSNLRVDGLVAVLDVVGRPALDVLEVSTERGYEFVAVVASE